MLRLWVKVSRAGRKARPACATSGSSDVTRRIADEPAYLLHMRPYRETSALLELLTPHHGCVSVVGKGLKGRRRQVVPTPFVRMRVSCGGRGSLLALATFESERRYLLEGDALFSGLYLNELLLRLVRHDDPHPALFEGYEATLAGLMSPGEVELCLRRFERLLLRECGYELSFDVDAATGEPISCDEVYTSCRSTASHVAMPRPTGDARSAVACCWRFTPTTFRQRTYAGREADTAASAGASSRRASHREPCVVPWRQTT